MYGVYELLDENNPSVFAYTRTHGEEVYLIVLNFSREHVDWEMPQTHGKGWVPVRFTFDHELSTLQSTTLRLGPYDGVICKQERCLTVDCDSK